jgi:hypothetical protein
LSRAANLGAPLSGPPAVWLAFAQQGRWKNWVLGGQFLLNAFLLLVCLNIAKTQPDIVVVGDDGQGHYVESSAASKELLNYLRNQRNRPTDTTVVAFTQRFVKLTSAVNSTTIDDAWSEALGLMAPPLRDKMAAEAKAQKLLETYHLAQVRTDLVFDDVQLVERHEEKSHVRALVHRSREKLAGGVPPALDALQVDLVLAETPRSRARPDGLEILDWRTTPRAAPPLAGVPTPSGN